MSEHDPAPEILTAADEAPTRDLRRRVVGLLAEGALVALPTETVYGLAARADHEGALSALIGGKARPRELGLTWHVARRDAAERFETLRPLVGRLVERYWPGPLTLVLSGVPKGLERVARDGWTGVRLPAHALTRGILDAADFPIVMSSANRHGDAPAIEAREVAARFADSLALVVDAGPSRLGESSGVLQVGPGRFELLREGLLPLDDLRATAGLRLAFACTGNTCRSPMAEVIAREILGTRLGLAEGERTEAGVARFGFSVRSMGVFAGPGSPASRPAQEVAKERGLDLSAHRSSPALPEEIAELDHVWCMTASHVDSLRRMLPPRHAKKVQLLDPGGVDVPDPIGGSREIYRACAARIGAGIAKRAEDWA